MSEAPVLEVRDLFKYFPVHQPITDSLMRRPQLQVKAVDDVSFSLEHGEVLAIVGKSGCGKTTIARTLIGLEERTKGEILFHGQAVGENTTNDRITPRIKLKQLRQRAQMIFQDPYESLNPRSTIFEIVAEPLVVHGIAPDRNERSQRVKAALEERGTAPGRGLFLSFST